MTDVEKSTRRDWIATARTLSEALPLLQRYDEAVVVVKFGGHAMGDSASMAQFARDIALMKQCGVNPVVVHGGGPQIKAMQERLGLEAKYIDGLRVTDQATVEVVEMVLAGSINKEIVTAIDQAGGRAVGLCGKDAKLLVCERETKTVFDPESNIEKALDLGFVGRPVKVNPQVLDLFFASDFIPVIAPVGVGKGGETYNVNGDSAAGALAGALNAKRLILLTDVAGVKGADGAVIPEMTLAEAEALIASGVISGGMIPKVRTAAAALAGGTEAVVIVDGRAPHAVLLELFTEHGAGTMIRA